MFPLLKRKGHILLLDDDMALQKLVATLLKRDGYRVDLVSNGREAIEAIGRENYDGILLDLMMPHEGGLTVIAHLRDHHPEILACVIVLTGTSASVLRHLQHEVAAVVQKPFEPQRLLDVLEEVVGVARR